MEVGEEGDYILYNILSLHCHHQIDSCIKTDICESRFNASLIVRDKATRQCPRTTTFLKRKRAEADSNRGPSAYQPNVLSLCQTGSHSPQERTWIDIIANWGLRGLADYVQHSAGRLVTPDTFRGTEFGEDTGGHPGQSPTESETCT